MSAFNSSLLPLSLPLGFERKIDHEKTFLPPVKNVFSFIFGYLCLLLTITFLLTDCLKPGYDNQPVAKNAYYEKGLPT